MNFRQFNTALLKITTHEQMEIFVERTVLHGTPFVFNGSEDVYYEFRRRVAKKFKINFHEVMVVGSGKLGFSYIAKKDKPVGREFDLDSDVDVVIVNEDLFERYYKAIAEYQYEIKMLVIRHTIEEDKRYYRFLQYLVRGWLRPDLLPRRTKIKLLKDEWFDYFRKISYNKSEIGNYKVAAGLYKNWDYLKNYYVVNLEEYKKTISIK